MYLVQKFETYCFIAFCVHTLVIPTVSLCSLTINSGATGATKNIFNLCSSTHLEYYLCAPDALDSRCGHEFDKIVVFVHLYYQMCAQKTYVSRGDKMRRFAEISHIGLGISRKVWKCSLLW